MSTQFENKFKIICRFFVFILISRVYTVADMDASHSWQTGFQDPATPIMEGIIFFNGLLMAFMILISCLVGWLLYKSLSLFDESVHANPVGFTHSTLLEVVWTIIPAAILMIISVPSYNLLYAMDEVIDPSLTIKVVGHQWYWSYECSDFRVVPSASQGVINEVGEVKDQLKLAVDMIEEHGSKIKVGEKRPQMDLIKEILRDLESTTNLKALSVEEAESLLNSLTRTNLLFQRNEGFTFIDPTDSMEDILHLKESHPSLYSVACSAVESIKKSSLISEQAELLMQILCRFRLYLKITENLQPGVTGEDIINFLYFLDLIDQSKTSSSSSVNDNLSFSRKGSDDSDDDNGSAIAELMYFDKSDPYWEWCELVAAQTESDKDYSELKMALSKVFTSERRCNNAALLEPEPEDENKPFLELVNNLMQDLRNFKKAKPVADLSESKLMDGQLIVHQLRLTRAEREIYSSEFAFDSAVTASKFAEVEFNTVFNELEKAKHYSHWCDIELAAANVNKLTAEFFQADASAAVTEPQLLRSAWINKKGYYSWHKFLKLVAKKLSEAERMVFLNVDEELSGANALLGKAQKDLTQEELDHSNAIADNAKDKFMAMEREVIPAMKELERGKVIVAEAKAELENFQELSTRANVRLEKAQASFDKVKPILDKSQARLRGAKAVYDNAQLKLTSEFNPVKLEFLEGDLEGVQNRFQLSKDKFDKAILEVHSAKSNLLVCKDRVKTVNMNLRKTEEVFENTGLLRTHTVKEGSSTEYYPNYLWEIRKEDLAFVKAQLKADTGRLESAYTSLEIAEKQLSEIGGELLELELKKSKNLINSMTQESGDVLVIRNIQNYVQGIELDIAEAIYAKALINFELDKSEYSKLILSRSEKALYEARLKDTSDYSGLALFDNIKGVESEKLISDYAESCLKATKSELEGAELDYNKATNILGKADSLLKNVSQELAKDYDNPCLNTLRDLHKKTILSLSERLDDVNLARLELSPLDIKNNPGVLQARSYQEVLLAKAELANIKWLCARVAKTLDIPLSNDVKPFNVQFSYLKDDDKSLVTNIGSGGEGYGEGGGSGDGNKAKTEDEIKEILSKSEDLKPGFDRKFLGVHILSLFTDLFKTLTKDQSHNLLKLFDNSLPLLVKSEIEEIQEINDEIKKIKEGLVSLNEKEEDLSEEEDLERINFDSYLISDEDLIIPEALGTGKAGKVFRLLEVDNRLFVPTNTHIRLLITSADVLHSWAVPSLGVKVDACPGRLNQVFLFVKREGVFYGQCSELCGVNHGFMPIVVQAVGQEEYLTWVGKRLCS